MRVLVVDDDDAMRGALQEFLLLRGMKVRGCKDGGEALGLFNKEKEAFHIVLTDLNMPTVGGLEVLRAAKQRDAETQVVIITGFASLETAIDSMRQGAFDYVTKPFKLVEIDLIINKIAERKRLLDENQKLLERIQSLYTRLDLLKDNRSKLDKFIASTSQHLEHHSQKIEECLELIKKISLHQEAQSTPRSAIRN